MLTFSLRVSKDAKLEIDEDAYVETFKPFMMDVVHEWCNGCSFSQLCKMTDLFEGEKLPRTIHPCRAVGGPL